MTQLLVVVLAVMWIVVIVPPLLRSRAIGRPSASVGDFRRHLSNLQTKHPQGRSPYGAPSQLRPVAAYRAPQGGRPVARRATVVSPVRTAMRQRRQNILVGLLGAAVLSGLLGFGMGMRTFMTINLVVDALLIGYVYLLVQIKKTTQTKAVSFDWSRAA